MYRDAPRGTNVPDQSATRSVAHVERAATRARLKFAARARCNGRTFPSNAMFNHRTGRPRVSAMSDEITALGYEASPCESMSFVPSATTTAVIRLLRARCDLTTVTASDTLRPQIGRAHV